MLGRKPLKPHFSGCDFVSYVVVEGFSSYASILSKAYIHIISLAGNNLKIGKTRKKYLLVESLLVDEFFVRVFGASTEVFL